MSRGRTSRLELVGRILIATGGGMFGVACFGGRNAALAVAGFIVILAGLAVALICMLSSGKSEWRQITAPISHCPMFGDVLKQNESGACSQCGRPVQP